MYTSYCVDYNKVVNITSSQFALTSSNYGSSWGIYSKIFRAKPVQLLFIIKFSHWVDKPNLLRMQEIILLRVMPGTAWREKTQETATELPILYEREIFVQIPRG